MASKLTICLAAFWILLPGILAGPSAGGADQKAEEMANLFPTFEGWSAKEKALLFYPESLYEYIDGAAEAYLSYEFQVLAVQNYENGAKKTLTIEIYRHSSSRNAYGIYSSEKPTAGDFLAIGDQGYQEAGVLNFLQGRYYVKMSALDLDVLGQKQLPEMAQQLSAQLGPKAGLPRELSFFPEEGKIPQSERYIHQNYLGYSYLQSAFRVDCRADRELYSVFLIDAGDAARAREMVKKWLESATKKSQGEIAEGRYAFLDSYHGPVRLEWKGSFIWGSIKCPENRVEKLSTELSLRVEKLKH